MVSWSGVGRMLSVCYESEDGPITSVYEQSEHNETDWKPVSEVVQGEMKPKVQ